jgi:hypothetical protein
MAIVPRPSLVAYASRVRAIENPIAAAAARHTASIAGASSGDLPLERNEAGGKDSDMAGIVNCVARRRELHIARIARKSQIRPQFRRYYL